MSGRHLIPVFIISIGYVQKREREREGGERGEGGMYWVCPVGFVVAWNDFDRVIGLGDSVVVLGSARHDDDDDGLMCFDCVI